MRIYPSDCYQFTIPLTVYKDFLFSTSMLLSLLAETERLLSRLRDCKVSSVVSDSVRPHRWKPTRLPRPWDSPGKNTGVGCHFLLQWMKVKSECEVAQSYPTLRDPVDHSLPGSFIHGIFLARVLEWGAIAFTISTLAFVISSFWWWSTRYKVIYHCGSNLHFSDD